MPSPFPGMDPYLEFDARWPDLHQRFITYSSELLQPQLEPKYIARIDERIEMIPFGRAFIPDVMVVEPPSELSETKVAYGSLVADEPQTISVLNEERRVPFIQVVSVASGEVITLIEFLGPGEQDWPGERPVLRGTGRNSGYASQLHRNRSPVEANHNLCTFI